MVSHIKNYLKDYGDDFVSEKSLKYLLPLLYPDVIKEVSIKKICSFYDNIKLFSEDIKNKRFDFISVSKKLIIEFDGRQHFEHIEHFGSFEQFVERQSIDLDKQRFIKENNFHLIRITGGLTLREFYNLIKDKKFDNDYGQVIFIEDTTLYETTTDQLKEMSDETSILRLKVKDLQNELNLMKNYINLNKLDQLKTEIATNLDEVSDPVYQFLLHLKEQKFLVGKIPINIMYHMYNVWNIDENKNICPLKSREFTARLKKHLSSFGLKLSDKQIRISQLKSTDFNWKLMKKYYSSSYIAVIKRNMTRYVECEDQINDLDITDMQVKLIDDKLTKDQVDNYKQRLILEHLVQLKDINAIKFKSLYFSFSETY